jgi:hypothetical protein
VPRYPVRRTLRLTRHSADKRCPLFSFDVQLGDQSRIQIEPTSDVSIEVGAAFGIGIEPLRGELRLDLRRPCPLTLAAAALTV